MNLAQWGALGALLAGVAWIVSFVVSLVVTGESSVVGLPSFYLIEGIIGLAPRPANDELRSARNGRFPGGVDRDRILAR